MTENKKLLIIEDDSERCHDLKIIFDFIGEVCETTTSDQWQSSLEDPEHFVGILLALPIAAVIAVVLRHVHDRYKQSELYAE